MVKSHPYISSYGSTREPNIGTRFHYHMDAAIAARKVIEVSTQFLKE